MTTDTALIPLTQGHSAIVDADDYERLSQWKWCTMTSRGGPRAKRAYRDENGKQQTMLMHRFIMGAIGADVVDHINHDTLDNRKANLRVCSRLENQRNSTSRKKSTSKYLGVDWVRRNQKWRARIQTDNGALHIGVFATEFEAARAYDVKAAEHFGEFANLNIKD